MTSISIVTVILNNRHDVEFLAESIFNQTNPNWKWLISDGYSTDGSFEYLNELANKDSRIKVIRNHDFSVFHAFNLALAYCDTEYYIPAGSDDTFSHDCIDIFYKAIEFSNKSDIIAAGIKVGSYSLFPSNLPSLFSIHSHISHHSIATLIKLDLHHKYGFYSKRFHIAADQYFLKKAFKGGATYYRIENYIAGNYGIAGQSSVDIIGTITELFRINLEVEKYKLVTFLLFLVRLLKNVSLIIKK